MVKIIGNFEVNDWVHWKKMFDQHSNAREAAGIKTIYDGCLYLFKPNTMNSLIKN